MINLNALKALRALYPEGSRIELIHMDDPYTSLKPGYTGTVTGLDDLGTIQMLWDSGSTLGLIPGVDKFEKLKIVSVSWSSKAIFARKAASLRDLKEATRKGGKPESFIIEKKVELEEAEYQDFCDNLLSDYDFIKDNLTMMHKDKTGTYHCLLVTAKGGRGGILVESEGYEYPRYTAIYNENE